ncbi:MauE/DoxX family redox-associated membrane protein [Nocardia sp. NPDC059180]|uniref:MauE/DoxX family redox-associated membrane protein n=1 Tax=Nocardia sp. NPDC059180 TaxID=3346761 RepID=UPI0036BB1BE8
MSYVVLACRYVLVGVLLVSLVGKLRGRTAYAEFVAATATLLGDRDRMAKVLAPLTIMSEVAIVCALVIEPARRLGLVSAVVLMACFAVALGRAVRLGSARSCRCFGASTTPMGIRHVVRNLVLAAAAVVGLALDLAVGPHRYELAGLAVIVPVVAACVVLTVRLDDLIDVLR